MSREKLLEEDVCRRCGERTGPEDVVVRHSAGDPLVVSECPGCGAVVRIGGHAW